MKTRIRRFGHLIGWLVMACSLGWAEAGARSLAVVVNRATPMPGEATPASVKEIYLGNAKFWGKDRIHPAALHDPSVFSLFLQKVMGMGDAEYQSLWVKKIFSEGAQPPKRFKTASEVVQFVSDDAQAVGFALFEDVAAEAKKEGAKIRIALVL